MRIQQMDRILKESRSTRRGNKGSAQRGFMARLWSSVVNLFHRRAHA